MPDTGSIDLIRRACAETPQFAERYDMTSWTEIGRGSFARIVKLHRPNLGQDVAVKIFLPGEFDADYRARVLREAAVGRRLSSRYVVKVYEVGDLPDLLWIEMEWIDGPDLKALLERGLPSFTTALQYARDLTCAVRDVHEAGVVHRDIKPDNIFLPPPGETGPWLKLGDFGISKPGDAAALTATGGTPGTPLYKPPETFRGEAFTEAGDLYSLGLVLYRLFTGCFPYELPDPPTQQALIVAHTKQTPTDPRQHNPELPDEAAHLVLRLLNREPNGRPDPTAILDVLRSLTVGVTPPPPPPPLRRHLPVVLVGAAGLALAAVLFWPGRGAAPVTPLPATPPTPEVTPSLAVPARGDAAPEARPVVAATAPPLSPPAPRSTSVSPAMRRVEPTPTAAPPPPTIASPVATPRVTPTPVGTPRAPPAPTPALVTARVDAVGYLTITNRSAQPLEQIRLRLELRGGRLLVPAVSFEDGLPGGGALLVDLDDFEVDLPRSQILRLHVTASLAGKPLSLAVDIAAP